MHNYVPPLSSYNDYLRESSQFNVGSVEFQRNKSEYKFSHFTEMTNPELALKAQQIQGESYLDAQYITEQDLDEYGRLRKDLDKARGDNVEYVVAERSGQAKGAVRLVKVPENGTLFDLPAYEKSVYDMHPGFKELIEQAYEDDNVRGVVEVAGLSRSKDAPPTVLLEIIREIVQQVVRSRSDELWLVTATNNSFNMIQSRFGRSAITPIGSRVPVLNDDIETREYLQPSLIEPGMLIENIANSIVLEQNSMQRNRLMKTLNFMVDGLDTEIGEVPQNAIGLLEENTKLGLR